MGGHGNHRLNLNVAPSGTQDRSRGFVSPCLMAALSEGCFGPLLNVDQSKLKRCVLVKIRFH